jgi:hypothetical protein
MPFDASDETQLLGATEQGRIIFTSDVGDFMRLAARYPHHAGIDFAEQRGWTLSALIHALDHMLSTTDEAEWVGQVRWLNQWRL